MGVNIKNITKERAERCFQFARDGWCIEEMPEIIELPPHGRLIDADAFCRNIAYAKADDFIKAGVLAYVADAPTIIPAEETET